MRRLKNINTLCWLNQFGTYRSYSVHIQIEILLRFLIEYSRRLYAQQFACHVQHHGAQTGKCLAKFQALNDHQ